mmetsp:Transcript_42416/g.120911  ORF Transcript_42416/g.120911 Transcript_42416/m.120911 type:complete len:99 (-) Transcript_42416:99-395(-)|eukprot:CAMPEP_0168412390 /NCGR_PEP_ID=MMETSP0228-20121227/28684_1 /TAXON_ID=133427 /ORGANISM="Protoceratium reticulatum, Strain CCCM 535 (=CCMP 1889)" /LENGTH=98 /DNA_ID=CAMNT_0008426151 /DNA_START=75 /DNA_END=371 /DNA_ORIENTATION=-
MGERDLKALTVGLGLIAVIAVLKALKPTQINEKIKKDCEKCVDAFAVGDLEELKKPDGKLVYCRCWRSKTFPYCDGSHAAHNKLTGDNVGPLIIKATK